MDGNLCNAWAAISLLHCTIIGKAPNDLLRRSQELYWHALGEKLAKFLCPNWSGEHSLASRSCRYGRVRECRGYQSSVRTGRSRSSRRDHWVRAEGSGSCRCSSCSFIGTKRTHGVHDKRYGCLTQPDSTSSSWERHSPRAPLSLLHGSGSYKGSMIDSGRSRLRQSAEKPSGWKWTRQRASFALMQKTLPSGSLSRHHWQRRQPSPLRYPYGQGGGREPDLHLQSHAQFQTGRAVLRVISNRAAWV